MLPAIQLPSRQAAFAVERIQLARPKSSQPMTDTVRTRRLICRIPRDPDSHLLLQIFSDPQTMTWFGPERVLSQEESTQWVENHERLRSTEGFAPWVICLEESGAVIG
jgi:RimJ/RimL family protein N-acetyltransferase